MYCNRLLLTSHFNDFYFILLPFYTLLNINIFINEFKLEVTIIIIGAYSFTRDIKNHIDLVPYVINKTFDGHHIIMSFTGWDILAK